MEAIGNIIRRVMPELFKESTVFRVIYKDKDSKEHTVYIMAKNQKEVMKKLKGYTVIKVEQYDTQLGVGA